MSSPELIQDAGGLAKLVARLERESLVAIDTEANSFHAYFERVCLVQIGLPDVQFLVDPLAVDPKPLAPIVADPSRLFIVHGGDYDVRILRRDFGFQFGHLFDTMLAAQLMGLPELGLAALLRSRLDVVIEKGEQRSDWGRRPLRPEQLQYAADDVANLIPLHASLAAQLAEKGRVPAAEAAFEKLRHLVAREKRFDPRGFQKLRQARLLGARERDVLAALWLGREEVARAL
ncbi:MAG: ribonuclease D, partial [Deltaproteobacteria bacterium]